MSDLFISDQRWIYAVGATLPDALRNLANELSDENISVPEGHYFIDQTMEKTTLIEVLYDDDPVDDHSFYRAGLCISWKPGS